MNVQSACAIRAGGELHCWGDGGYGVLGLGMVVTPAASPTRVGSDDDWYMSPDEAEALAQAWGSRYVQLEKAGHINTDSGFGPWPEGERLLAGLLAGAKETP